MTSPDRCFVSLAAVRCDHCSGRFHRSRNPTPNTDNSPNVLGQTHTFTAFLNRSAHKIGHQTGRQCDEEGLQTALTVAAAHQSSGGSTHQSNASGACVFLSYSLGFRRVCSPNLIELTRLARTLNSRNPSSTTRRGHSHPVIIHEASTVAQ